MSVWVSDDFANVHCVVHCPSCLGWRQEEGEVAVSGVRDRPACESELQRPNTSPWLQVLTFCGQSTYLRQVRSGLHNPDLAKSPESKWRVYPGGMHVDLPPKIAGKKLKAAQKDVVRLPSLLCAEQSCESRVQV